jgi:elongation factor P hydroxylase
MATFIQWHFQPVEPKKDAIASHMRTIMGGYFHTVEQLENSKGVKRIYNNLKEIEDLKEIKKQHIPTNVKTFITNFCKAYEEKNMKKWKILWSKWHHDHPFADFMIQKLGLIRKNNFSEVGSFEKLLKMR